MAATTGHDVGRNVAPRSTGARRLVTETKSALKTTELWVYVAATIAVLVAAMVVDETDAGGFGAKQIAWKHDVIAALIPRSLTAAGHRSCRQPLGLASHVRSVGDRPQPFETAAQ